MEKEIISVFDKCSLVVKCDPIVS